MKDLSLTSNKLKQIAILAMFFDHFTAVFISHDIVIGMALRLPGRIVAPIMCFMIAEGYYKTSNVKIYISRLLIFAVISHIPYNLCFGYSLSPLQATSVMWSLALGLIALTAVKSKHLPMILRWIVIFGIFYGDFFICSPHTWTLDLHTKDTPTGISWASFLQFRC